MVDALVRCTGCSRMSGDSEPSYGLKAWKIWSISKNSLGLLLNAFAHFVVVYSENSFLLFLAER